MKNLLLSFCFLFCFISCDNKAKYQGQWTNWFFINNGYNETGNTIIKNDSIIFNYPYFHYPISYRLSIENKKFAFNNISVKASVEKDTLTLNDSVYFVRDNMDTLSDSKILLKINLPEIPYLNDQNRYNDDLIINVLFGKKIDRKEFSLQINDRYAEITDLPEYASIRSCGGRQELMPFYSTYLFIDKSTPMKFVEDIFYNLTIVNNLKVCFINKMDLSYNDSLGLHYKFNKLTKKLPPLSYDTGYTSNTSKKAVVAPPPPPISLPLFESKDTTKTRFIYLKENKILYNDKTIKPHELKTLTKSWIEDSNVIFSLYDLESEYGNFLKMTVAIDNAYDEIKNTQSKQLYRKPLSELNQDEYSEISMKIRKLHIWSYSIPHYNSIISNKNSFFGIKMPHNN